MTDVIPIHPSNSAVAGPMPSGCTTSDNSAVQGEGYYQASLATGGAFLSICDDWGDSIEELAGASQKSAFSLSKEAVESSIEVTVDGLPAAAVGAAGTSWEYSPPSNAVSFLTAGGCLPDDGAAIEVAYSVFCWQLGSAGAR